MPLNQVQSQLNPVITHGPDETRELGKSLAARMQPGDLLTLSGELGAGKTAFVQGLAEGLGVQEPANSPTFVLMIEHAGRFPLLHLDAYRLEGAPGETICYDALRDAGVLDFFDREDAIKVVEWPQRLVDVLPKPRFEIVITHGAEENERLIEIVEAK